MMTRISCCLSVILLAGLNCLSVVEANGVCFLLYQMADNDLEYFLRQDNNEFIRSQAIRDRSLTTWVYFDHRNFGSGEDIFQPLPDVYNPDGSAVTGQKIQTSQYLTYNHNLQKMVIYGESNQELDGDDPDTVYSFAVTALADCIQKGSKEFMIVFSSHGTGFLGFGGDEYDRRRRRNLFSGLQNETEDESSPSRQRSLRQPNSDIVRALRQALTDTTGAPTQFDVIGFDACLMMSIGALDDYRDIAKYTLASQAVEPGHGWAYDVLKETNTALGLATDMQKNYLTQKQGYVHQTPKTLAIVNNSKFSSFLSNWNLLCREMRELLTDEDPDFYTQLTRARDGAISFDGPTDDGATEKPSAIDVGSFLTTLRDGCNPIDGSNLSNYISRTLSSYNAMFEVRGVGPGTPAATGMHVAWPARKEYIEFKGFFDPILFDTRQPFATADAPEWIDFLKIYYTATLPPNIGQSVCQFTTSVGLSNNIDSLLMIDPFVERERSGKHEIGGVITREVSYVNIEYGMDLTPLLDSRRRFRKLKEEVEEHRTEADRLSFLQTWDIPSHPMRKSRHRLPQSARSGNRRLQMPGDYFILFGGDTLVEYDQDTFASSWNRNFYLFGDVDGNTDYVYAWDSGSGLKEIPVVYFPPNMATTTSQVLDFIDEADALAAGGEYGFVTFSTTNIDTNGFVFEGFTLYTYGIGTDTVSEKPRNAGGQIVPIVYTEGEISGQPVFALVGGFSGTVVDFNSDSEFFAAQVSANELFDNIPELDFLIIDLLAFNEGSLSNSDSSSTDYQFEYFDIDRQGKITWVTSPNPQTRGSEATTLSLTTTFAVSTMLLSIFFIAPAA